MPPNTKRYVFQKSCAHSGHVMQGNVIRHKLKAGNSQLCQSLGSLACKGQVALAGVLQIQIPTVVE